MRKKTTLLIFVFFCSLIMSIRMHAQERLWVADTQGRLHSMNTNGGDVFSNSQFGDRQFGYNVHAFALMGNVPGYQGQFIIPTTRGYGYDDNYQGAINVVGPEGLRKIYNVDYLEDRSVSGIQATSNGFVMASVQLMQLKWNGIVQYPYDGSGPTYFNKSNIDFSAEYLLTTVGDTIFGVSRGDANNNGFIYRIKPEGLTNGPAEHIFDFTDGDQGLRPIGRLLHANGFLFGYTKFGGLNNKGVFFKVKTDGSAYEKLFDLAATSLATSDFNGKYQTLLDVISKGYVPPTDQQGNYFVHDAQGIYKVSAAGDFITLISTVNAEKIQIISAQFQHVVKVSNIQDGAIGIPTSVTTSLERFSGAQLYQLEVSTTPDFSAGVQTQVSTSIYFELSLLPGTKYYTRARTDIWPYYGEIVSFTTESESLVTPTRFYIKSDPETLSVAHDGSDAHLFEESSSDILQLENGDKLYFGEMRDESGGDATVWKITPNGKVFLYQDVLWMRGIDPKYMADGGDGYAYSLSYSVLGSEARSLVRFALDGSGIEEISVGLSHIVPSSYLTNTPQGVYGVTRGSAANQGFIFKVKSDLSGLEPVFTFSNAAGGIRPYGKLLVGRDGFLYGTTRAGGANNAGVIFKVSLTGTDYTVLHHFVPINGKNPNTGLIQDSSGVLYGTTTLGGKNGYGVLYKINEDGSGFQKLLDYFYTGKKNEVGNLAVDDSFVFATTGFEMFRINKDGTGFQLLDTKAHIFQDLPNTGSNLAITYPVDHTTPIEINSVITATPILGAKRYYFEMSTSPTFDSNVIIVQNDSAHFNTTGLDYDNVYFIRARTNLSPSYGPVSTFVTSDAATHVYVINPVDGATDFGEVQMADFVQGWVTMKRIPRATHYTLQISLTAGFLDGAGYTYEVDSSSADLTVLARYLQPNRLYYTRARTDLSSAWGPLTSFTTLSHANQSSSLEVYPNPSAKSFALKPNAEATVEEVIITDATGNVLYQNDALKEGETFGESLRRGIYILTIRSSRGRQIIRLVKE